jgi:hypothetical protein
MTNKEMAAELDELMTRFKRLKKSLDEEQYERLSPAQQAIAEAARQFKGDLRKADKATLLKKAREIGEQQQAQRLANQLQRSGILGSGPRQQLQPSGADQETWLKNNGFQTEDQLAKQESEWGNGINNWLQEATKPINQRFKSEEEERAYWDRIKVSDNGRGNEGF